MRGQRVERALRLVLSWQEVLCLNSLMMAEKKTATSMLWISFLLCHHETEVGPSGSLPTKPPICLVLSVTNCNCSGFFFFFNFIFEGVAGIARI